MIQFFAPDIDSVQQLPPDEAAHCVRVLRRQPGDIITVIDGKGYRYECRLTEASAKRASVEIVSRELIPRAWCADLYVAVAPTKHMDRMEWLVEKLVESGVDRIIPLRCDRSERKEIKVERLEKIAISAMKQSLKATMPLISPITPLDALVKQYAGSGTDCFMAYCDRSIPRRLFTDEYRPGTPTLMMIGPEGDFSPAEIERTLSAGFTPVSLGDVRLRTETAALYAIMAAHAIAARELHKY